MKKFLTLFAVLTALSSAALAADGDYPNKPVRIVVPTAPGGGVDVLARLIGQKLGERFGGQFFIDNRPGAAGVIGTRAVTASAPDGYTLLMAPSSLAITAAIKKKMPYDLVRDLTPIMSVASTPYALMVNPTVPARSVKELIAYAKANPDKLNVSSAGVGSASHLAAELFDAMADIKMTHVPNKGMGPAMVDVLGGQVQVLFAGLPAALTAEKAGTVRVLAVAGPTRSVLLPEKPTIAEAGLPGYEVDNWIGMLAPAGLDPAIVSRLNSEIRVVLDDQEIKQKLIELGFEPTGSTPAAFAAQLDSDVKKWAKIAKQAGVSED
jgi:tripartite-type tricarboxylate transporter receptor subunit TctC